MIECEKLLRELDLYLDGELPVEEQRLVETHFSECDSCFRRHSFVRSLRELIRRKCGKADLPEGVEERIRSSIRTALQE